MDAKAFTAYVNYAYDQMVDVIEKVGDRIDERPFGDVDANTIGAIVVHCVELSEYWLGHVALGRPSTRDRDAEFRAALPATELLGRISESRVQIASDLAALESGQGQRSDARGLLLAGGTDESVALHVIEEMYQHLGHMQLTVDVFRERGWVRPDR